MATAKQRAAQARFKGAVKACKGKSHAKTRGGKSQFNLCVKAHISK